MSFEFKDGKWYGPMGAECSIVHVPIIDLVTAWELLVIELSSKEKELYLLKEEIFNKKQDIIRKTNFNKLYNANNKDVRKEHLDKVLAEDYTAKKNLEFRIDFIKQYIPLVKEVVRCKVIEKEMC